MSIPILQRAMGKGYSAGSQAFGEIKYRTPDTLGIYK